jgi:3-dehydroquinate dehydratase
MTKQYSHWIDISVRLPLRTSRKEIKRHHQTIGSCHNGSNKAMDEELDQIEKNDTWELVPRPKNKNVIGTKWVFRNKLNEDGQVTRNKARLVCKGYA